MAPGKGRGMGKQPATKAPRTSGRRTAASRKREDVVPNVYDEMLAEAADEEPSEPQPPPKRRKVAKDTPTASTGARTVPAERQDAAKPAAKQAIHSRDASPVLESQPQTVEDSSEDDESEFGFEDVDLDEPTNGSSKPDDDGIEDISVSIDPAAVPHGRPVAKPKRRPATASEKAVRMIAHKAHVLSLLAHCIHVNSWCNNETVQRALRKILNKRTLSYLDPEPSMSQFQRNRSFMEGLEQAVRVFKQRFSVTESGMRKARWTEGQPETNGPIPEPMDRSDFIAAAKSLEGSQDTGNQLFCALLRAADVEARMVCSLQPLPFGMAEAKSPAPQKYKKPTVFAIAPDHDLSAGDVSTDDGSVKSSASMGKVPSARRRLGQPGFTPDAAPRPPPKARKKLLTLAYPVFWVEAFDEAQQKWIAVDPIVTETINRPTKFEPPSSYAHNQLTYVVAFEDDCVARDVTRRYAKAYNAKTRKQRVESSGEEGAHWWKQTMRFFRRRGTLDRDQVEDAELSQKEAREGLPSNVQDFKNHPHYALERHLKRHEVLHPRREVGKVNAGTPAKPRMEGVFRRRDVVVCKSADKWYRLGREIKPREQPLKHVVAARSRRARSVQEGEEDSDVTRTALYGPFQTSIYIPSPVVDGRVPRNGFGNLDIYVPSMIPAGGAHVKHALAQKAAKLLRIDFADAVTGFQFKGRQGTAVVEGAVVAAENEAAVREVIEGFEQEVQDDAWRARSLEALRRWKKFFKALEIQERMKEYGKEVDLAEEVDKAEDEEGSTVEAGGFFPDEGADQVVLPTAGRFSLGGDVQPSGTGRGKGTKRVAAESEESEESALECHDDEAEDDEPHSDVPQPSRHLPRRAATRRAIVENEDDPEKEELYTRDADGSANPLAADYEGGGFLPDDGEEDLSLAGNNAHDYGGSGFSAEDANTKYEPQDGPDHDPSYEDGGGFIVDDSTVEDSPIATERLRPDDQHGNEQPPAAPPPQNDCVVVSPPTRGHLGPDRQSSLAATPLQSVAVAAAAEEEEEEQAPGPAEPPAPGQSPRDVEMADAVPGPTVGDGNNVADVVQTPESDESDKGSMLSHDPEDSDAEPDWLEDGD